MAYEEFLAQHLFAPAGMTSTGYVLPEWEPGQVAVEYDAHGRPHGRPFDHPWAADGPYWNLRGNGGLLSTARDMFRWHLALEGDEVLDDPTPSDQLFGPTCRKERARTPSTATAGSLRRPPGVAVGHDGGNGWSYGEIVRLLDEGVMVFWVTNHSKDDAAGWDMSRLGTGRDAGSGSTAAGALRRPGRTSAPARLVRLPHMTRCGAGP